MGEKLIPTLDKQQIDRFWSNVAKTNADTCWEWCGYQLESGYGQIK
jgi:hypothetical protein